MSIWDSFSTFRATTLRTAEPHVSHPVARDPDLAVAQRAFEREPAIPVSGQGLGPQNQNAAIRLVQRAGPDEGEIGLQHAADLAVLDAAKDVGISRVGFENNGRLGGGAIVDK